MGEAEYTADSAASLPVCLLLRIYLLFASKNPDILEAQSNAILTAIVNGMRKEEPSDHVKLAASNALLNSLEFTRSNFSK